MEFLQSHHRNAICNLSRRPKLTKYVYAKCIFVYVYFNQRCDIHRRKFFRRHATAASEGFFLYFCLYFCRKLHSAPPRFNDTFGRATQSHAHCCARLNLRLRISSHTARDTVHYILQKRHKSVTSVCSARSCLALKPQESQTWSSARSGCHPLQANPGSSFPLNS
jgi:hypothetical protein